MVTIEGQTPDELFALPADELDQLIFIGRPIIVRVGSAAVLAECHRRGADLVLDLAQIDGGGEGVLPTLAHVVERFARSRGFERVEWLVRATNCAHPNEKLRRVLVGRGFRVGRHPEFGECYCKVTIVGSHHVR
jgi:hypothetical protein